MFLARILTAEKQESRDSISYIFGKGNCRESTSMLCTLHVVAFASLVVY